MTVLTRMDFVLACFCIGIIPAILYFIDPDEPWFALYGSFAAGSALFFWLFFKCRIDGGASKFWYFLVILWLLGSVFGLINVLTLDNDVSKFLNYFWIHFVFVVALGSGEKLGSMAAADPVVERRLVLFLVLLAASELLLFVPRVFSIGLYVRTSVGFTFLFPLLLYAVLQYYKDRVWSVPLLALLVGLVVAIALLSGQRTMVVATLVMLIYFIFASVLRSSVFVKLIGVMMFSAVAFLAVDTFEVGGPVLNSVHKRLLFIEMRIRNTFLSEEGLKLDANPESGRVGEARLALNTFFGPNHTYVDDIFGRGFGFVFPKSRQPWKKVAHTHVTVVGYFLRNGVVGVVFLFLLMAIVVWLLLWVHITQAKLWLKLASVVLLVWSIAGQFSGILNNPIFWFILGILIAIQKNERVAEARDSGRRVLYG